LYCGLRPWLWYRVYSLLADGSYTFRVMAMASPTDGGTPASFFFNIDTTPPLVSNFTYTIRAARSPPPPPTFLCTELATISPSVVGHMSEKLQVQVLSLTALQMHLSYTCSCALCGPVGSNSREGVKLERKPRKITEMEVNFLPLPTCYSNQPDLAANGHLKLSFYIICLRRYSSIFQLSLA
jgi:hypothetical protein